MPVLRSRVCLPLTRALADPATDRRPARCRRLAVVALTAITFPMVPKSALAQFAANLSLESNIIFRGETISQDDLGASVAISYDHKAGLFAGTGVTIAAGKRSPRIVAASQYAGFALRRGRTSFEIGAIHRDYANTPIVDEAYRSEYFEGFVGVSRGKARVRLYISPDYLVDSRTTYYGDLNAQLLKLGKWSFNGHGGLSVIPQDVGTPGGMRYYYDWSVSAGRSLGKFNASLAVSGTNYPIFARSKGTGIFSNKPRMVATIARAF